jgi:hypothetical protein
MTIVFTGIVGQIIVMTADSVITNDFGDHKEYGADVAKVYRFPGIGCVGAWGERVGNKLGLMRKCGAEIGHCYCCSEGGDNDYRVWNMSARVSDPVDRG